MCDILNEQHNAIIVFLKKAGLVVDKDVRMLEGQLIPRDLLLLPEKYTQCHDDLMVLKQYMSSSSLTSLQSTAHLHQKWPLLNAVRQILKVQMLRMVPVRIADGYTKDGKKIIKRFFRIERIVDVNKVTDINEMTQCDESQESYANTDSIEMT